jgi:hypothetical protein
VWSGPISVENPSVAMQVILCPYADEQQRVGTTTLTLPAPLLPCVFGLLAHPVDGQTWIGFNEIISGNDPPGQCIPGYYRMSLDGAELVVQYTGDDLNGPILNESRLTQ